MEKQLFLFFRLNVMSGGFDVTVKFSWWFVLVFVAIVLLILYLVRKKI